MKIIIVDIDGTICTTDSTHDYEKALPRPEQIKKINKLYEKGNTIIYWTARGASSKGVGFWHELTEKQLEEWGCKYDVLKVVGSKPSYDLWIDDKAVRIEEI